MDGCNCFNKKITLIKRRMAQGDPPKEAGTVKDMNDRSLLLSSNKMKNYFKDWTTTSGVLKRIYGPYKTSMIQIPQL